MANFARIRLILELHDRGMSQDEISRSRHMSRSTITTVLRTVNITPFQSHPIRAWEPHDTRFESQ